MLKKQPVCTFLIIVFVLLMAACPADDSSADDNLADNDGTKTTIPNVPKTGNADSEPVTGNANTKDANAVITLKGVTAEYTGSNVNIVTSNVYGTIVEITGNGTYVVQGRLSQGFVAVSKKDLEVTIVLNGVNIYCKNYAALTCLKKSNVTVALAENSVNYLTDGGAGIVDDKYPLGYDDEEQPNAALFIRRNLTIKGPGKLIVTGNGNNGIGSRARLTIEGGEIMVTSAKNALKGNDAITITSGTFSLLSYKDAIKTESTNGSAGDDGLGMITITGGEFDITAVNDAVQSSTSLSAANAVFNIKTGGGNTAAATADSAKGLKAATGLIIHSGVYKIDSNDDSIHSNDTVTINGGAFTITSGDDGIHADNHLTINNGNIHIAKSYEGLESRNITLNGGSVRIKAADDGINISNGADSSAAGQNRPGMGGTRPGQPGGFETVIDGTLTINGGEYYVESTGDGLDSNGTIVMSGGTVVIFGPTAEPEVPIDFNGTYTMTGGTIIALGYYGNMAQQPTAVTQYSFLAKFSSAVSAGFLINVSSDSGTEIVTVKAVKSARGIVVCSPLLASGTYRISSGGTHSGTLNDLNLMTGGIYSGGTVIKTFTLSNMITTIN